ncbi:hypothetical protein G6F37_000782 [Rhizopus arrhizus]|nr:hypothetical protein G6F38_003028 [Rhizopus arrhizus]KAG1163907.1 hypothetical protein G6F37_000782 [Rhizopus arrhizus]
MAVDIPYKRLQTGNNEIKGSLLVKYKLAKGLTVISLLAIILMAGYSLFHPGTVHSKNEDNVNTSVHDNNIPAFIAQKEQCQLPNEILIEKPTDGSYAPPSPHPSLLQAVGYASRDEYENYCKQYDETQGGFTDEWKYNKDGECGNWQEKYIKLHKKNMNILEKYKNDEFPSDIKVEERPRFISYLCKEVPKDSNRGCGGLADRMGGMISTFFYALLTDRAYLLNWAEMNPLPLEDVWERPHIEWSHDPKEMELLFSDEENPLLGYQKVDLLNRKYKDLTATMFPDGGNTEFKDLWNGTYVEVRSNRGFIIRTFQISQKYKKILNKMGLTKENAFKCITNFLFRPTIGSRRFLNAYKSLFEMESVLSIGIQIRTDDNALANPQYDINGLEKWGHFLKCAGDLAKFKRKAHHKRIVFFLVTDSAHLRNEFVSLNVNKDLAKKYLDEDIAESSSMVITGLPIEHIEPEQIAKYIEVENPKEINKARMQPGVNSAYMENWLLGLTQYRVISVQGYGKMASFYSGEDMTSISMPKNGRNNPPICSTESSFTTFNWLSTQWSLG